MYTPVPVFTWTGFYLGAQLGYGWADNENNDFLPEAFVFTPAGTLVPFTGGFNRGDSDGFLAGVHAGYNFQFGQFVLGVEGDVEGVFADDDDDDPFRGVLLVDRNGQPIIYRFGDNGLDWAGSIRARAGVAFDRLLIYATGGWAFGGVSGGFGNDLFNDSGDDTIDGWTIGGGVEWAITNNLTTRLEYRFTSFDRDHDVFNNINIGDDSVDFHTIRAGLSFKF
jgi:outer membrane immunogenic protein